PLAEDDRQGHGRPAFLRRLTMATIYKPTGRQKYIIEYVDENGKRCRKTGTTDRRLTERLAAKIVEDVALRKGGLVDAKAEAYRDHETLSLTDHLDDFERALVAKGDGPKHAHVTVYRAGRIIELAKARRISDLSLSKTLDALQSLRNGEGDEDGFNQQT